MPKAALELLLVAQFSDGLLNSVASNAKQFLEYDIWIQKLEMKCALFSLKVQDLILHESINETLHFGEWFGYTCFICLFGLKT